MRSNLYPAIGSAGLKSENTLLEESLHQHNTAEENTSRLEWGMWLCVRAWASHPSLLSSVLSLKCCSLLGRSGAQPQRSLWFKSTLNSGQRLEGTDQSSPSFKGQPTNSTEIIACPPKKAVKRPHRPVKKGCQETAWKKTEMFYKLTHFAPAPMFFQAHKWTMHQRHYPNREMY